MLCAAHKESKSCLNDECVHCLNGQLTPIPRLHGNAQVNNPGVESSIDKGISEGTDGSPTIDKSVAPGAPALTSAHWTDNDE